MAASKKERARRAAKKAERAHQEQEQVSSQRRLWNGPSTYQEWWLWSPDQVGLDGDQSHRATAARLESALGAGWTVFTQMRTVEMAPPAELKGNPAATKDLVLAAVEKVYGFTPQVSFTTEGAD